MMVESRCAKVATGAGVGDVVGGHVHRLHRGHRALLGRRDALLERAHLRRHRRLVAHRGLGMRPRSADTSEPACTKRKMLSTKSSTSWPRSSRKCSAIVRPESATRRREPGRLVHLPEDEHRVVDHRLASAPSGVVYLASVISSQRSLPFARALADAAEHGEAALLHRGDADELLDQHGLADTRAAEQADLAALRERAQEVDHLQAGLEHLGDRLLLLEERRRAVDRRASRRSSISPRATVSSASPRRLKIRPFVRSPTGTLIGAPVLVTVHAAAAAIGGGHRDAARHVVAEVLGHLEYQVADPAGGAGGAVHAQRVVDRRQRASAGKRTSTTGPKI